MSPLVRELLINGLMAGTAARAAKKTSAGVGYYALAGSVGAVGFVFFAMAGHAYLLDMVSPPLAAAIVGGVIMSLAVMIGAIGHYTLNKKKITKKFESDGNFVDMIEKTIKSFVEGIEEPVKDNPKAALLMAALAGFAAGDKLGDRPH